MRLFRWNQGRQQTGYEVFPFVMLKRFDFYLLRYRSGVGIPDHRDPAPGFRHFRLNWIIWAGSEGGEFVSESCLFSSRRIKLFRPDLSTHSVSPVLSGIRLVLSLGWLLKESK